MQGTTRLNPKDQGVTTPTCGTTTYDLYVTGAPSEFGQPSQFGLEITFADQGRLRVKTTGPSVWEPSPTEFQGFAPPVPKCAAATAPPAGTTPITETGGSEKPNTHKSIPDFWVGLSAAVVTRGTLGIGRDLALTTGTTNNQVLTVTVFERATGCLVQGTWVELWDPNGHAVPRTRFQTRAGIVDMGGIRLSEAGIYHLWIAAKNTAGKVVMEAYLPIQVKDRKGQPFVTLNGRQFVFQGGEWVEGTRTTQSAKLLANPFDAFATAFRQLLSGISSGVQKLFTASQSTKARSGGAILGNLGSAAEARMAQVQSKTGLYPSFLVTGTMQAADPSAATVTRVKVRLISQDGGTVVSDDGASLAGHGGDTLLSNSSGRLITNDGGTLITNDGGTLITNDGGTLVARGGNIISGVGPGSGGRSIASARSDQSTTGPQSNTGACASGFKTVGAGRTVSVGGTSVLTGGDGKLTDGTYVIVGRNAMPVNGFVG